MSPMLGGSRVRAPNATALIVLAESEPVGMAAADRGYVKTPSEICVCAVFSI
jgi:hypothetical protein